METPKSSRFQGFHRCAVASRRPTFVASTRMEEPAMKKTLLITVATVVLIVLAAAAMLFTLGAIGGSVDDPASASCPHPPTTLGSLHVVLDHREVAVHFTCSGARLSGTLFLPRTRGPHPAVVWVHGSG